MSLVSRFLGRLWRLPPALARDIQIEPVRILMRDGVELLGDRYYSRRAGPQPALLIRSCYGRGSLFKTIVLLFAERGVQVVVQSCRGTGGSGGVFRPFFDEQPDGEDTVQWIERQPWFNGDLALWGISYLGNTAWAVASSAAGSRVKAIGFHVTLTNFRDRTYAFGGFTFESCIGWTATMRNVIASGGMGGLSAIFSMCRARALTERALQAIPLRDADRVLANESVGWWQDWMDHAEPGDRWWEPIDYGRAAETLPPAVMVAGWYDIFLPWQLRDFRNAQRAGRDVRIVIGPWMHAAPAGMAESARQSIALFQERFGIAPGSSGGARAVRLFLQGANEWREYPSWPVPNAIDRTFYLHDAGLLDSAAPESESISTFDYDPAHPTPSLYGPTLEGSSGSGDMGELERRNDVLLFTTARLEADLDAIGPVSAEIFLRSSTEHTDLYLCLCDVTPRSRSTNVCDGYVRLRPADFPPDGSGVRKVGVEFWPTAYRFRRGHRLRVIVASGAHPRYSRNPGTGEGLGDARAMVIAHQEILHGPAHPSSVTLSEVR